MSNIEIVLVSLALGTDLFSVAIPIGIKPIKLKIVLRAALTFALFHIVLILAGYHMGNLMGTMVERMGTYNFDRPFIAIGNWASILGALVLVGLGIYMIKENLYPGDRNEESHHPLQGLPLLLLATSVSVDALAAGFSLGMMDVDLIRLSFILGAIIFTIGVVGLSVGHRLGQYIGKRAEIIGGMVLIFLGLHVLWCAVY